MIRAWIDELRFRWQVWDTLTKFRLLRQGQRWAEQLRHARLGSKES